jgi:hypothetical protein
MLQIPIAIEQARSLNDEKVSDGFKRMNDCFGKGEKSSEHEILVLPTTISVEANLDDVKLVGACGGQIPYP